MHVLVGLLGAFVFAFGGAISFYELINSINRSSFETQSFGYFFGFFISLFMMGIGLWLIALSARNDEKEKI